MHTHTALRSDESWSLNWSNLQIFSGCATARGFKPDAAACHWRIQILFPGKENIGRGVVAQSRANIHLSSHMSCVER